MSESSSTATTVLASGARVAERVLLDEVRRGIEVRDALVREALARGDAAAVAPLLAAPLRIVVPSRPLREHVTSALLRHCGRALAGVVVQTHRALALAVIERAGEVAPRGDPLFGIAVRRAAAQSPILAEALGALRDGYASVEATARDLSDAGFTPAHAEAVEEWIAAQPADAATCARAQAVVAATARALQTLERDGAAPRAALLQRATELLALRGAELLPTRALWLHGYTDATGAVTDWLLALLRACGGRAIVDVPPSPFEAGVREDEFPSRLLERLSAVAMSETVPEAATPVAADITLLRAPGTSAEVRAVATRVRALLDSGTRPESIGLVVRRPETHRSALDAQLARLAIPFSAHGVSHSAGARARRAAALVRVLEEGARAPVAVWLAAAGREDAAATALRAALHTRGVGRLADLVALDFDCDGDFADAQQRAAAALAHLDAWPADARCEEYHAQLLEWIGAHLGWSRDAHEGPLLDALDALAGEVPAGCVIGRSEWMLLVDRALARGAADELGGAGGGVQVLSVTAARGRCFEHLFVLGLNRGAFPRQPVEDPLLPDVLRAPLQALLPDLPVLARGYAEERHLFAELLSASPRVGLCWQFVSEEGRESARSTFVGRLLLLRPDLPVASVVALERESAGPRRAHEHALRAALSSPRSTFAAMRAEALHEVRRATFAVACDVAAIARAQSAVLEELDPDLRTREGRARASRLGPFLGFTGARSGDETLHVTRIEALSRCPWQAFLRRQLKLEPVRDPLAQLPHLDPRLRGQAAHAALERIVADAGAAIDAPLDVAVAGTAVRVAWPDPDRFAAIVHAEALRAAAEAGIRNAGFVRVLARWTGALLEVARETEWGTGAIPVVGAELHWHAPIEDVRGRPRLIAFRADRADFDGTTLRLTDYKTGRLPSQAGDAGRRDDHFLADVRRGAALQAVAYAIGAEALAARGEGRLLFLQEGADAALRERAAKAEDEVLVEAFASTARIALAAYDGGAHVPRLVEPASGDEFDGCAWCDVRMACLRGESAPRRRLREWANAVAPMDPALASPLREAADLLWLGRVRNAEEVT